MYQNQSYEAKDLHKFSYKKSYLKSEITGALEQN